MAKFHVNPESGDFGPCTASKRACPLGGSQLHFETEAAAKAVSEEILSERYATPTKPKGKLIIYVGVPGSGKSTLAAKKAEETGGVELNRDDKRTELYGESYHNSRPDNKKEAAVTAILKNKMISILRAGGTVVDSNTNTNPRFLAALISQAKQYGADVEIITVDVSLAEAKRRNKARGAQGGRLVPDFVIDQMATKIYSADGTIKEVAHGAKGVFFLDKDTPGKRLLAEYSAELEAKYPILSKDIAIVDIDGTLSANHKEVENYITGVNVKKDWMGFFKASAKSPVNKSVLELVKTLRAGGVTVFALTGRQDSSAEDTINFLKAADAPISRVIMARDGDFRGDYDAKTHAVEGLEAEGFSIVHSIDDRPSSIKVWEDRGIMVSRVPEALKVDGVFLEPQVNSFAGEGFCVKCGLDAPIGVVIHEECRTK